MVTPLLLGLLVLACVFTVTQARRATRASQSTRRLGAVVAALAAGDVRAAQSAIPPKEVPMAREAATVVANFRELLTQVQDVNSALSAGRTEVDAVALQMLTTTESTAERGTAVAEAAERVATNMQTIAAACEEMSATIREISNHASAASTVAATASERADAASARVHGLLEAAGNVERLSDFITGVAKQTHLLALNATIEAAHAGAQGSGFAVVAQEVKHLATQTSSSTATIETTIRDIQLGADQARDAMSAVTSIIASVTDNQNAIASAVEEQTATTNSIGASAAIAAASSTDLAGNIAGLLTTIRQAAYAGAACQVVAGDLTDIESDVTTLLERYSFDRAELPQPVQPDLAQLGVTVTGGVKTVQHYVVGPGPDQWSYSQDWRHATKELEIEGRHDSYSSMPGDVATFRFTGTKIRVYGFAAPGHGIGAISLDGQAETYIDLYADQRCRRLMFESNALPATQHTLTIRVTGEKNPQSRYIWIPIEKAEVQLPVSGS